MLQTAGPHFHLACAGPGISLPHYCNIKQLVYLQCDRGQQGAMCR